MRFFTCSLATLLFLSGCALQGTVVRKEFRPLPFSESIGIGAIYKFDLKDSSGQVRSQMVTPEVFASYEVGDYFNDLQPPPPDRSYKGGRPAAPEVEPLLPRVPRHGPTERYHLPYQPERTTSAPAHASGSFALESIGKRRHSVRSASAHRVSRHDLAQRPHRHHAKKLAKKKSHTGKIARQAKQKRAAKVARTQRRHRTSES